MWQLIKDLWHSIATYFQRRKKQQQIKELYREVKIAQKDKKIDRQVQEAIQADEEEIIAAGSTPAAYKSAFERLRQQGQDL